MTSGEVLNRLKGAYVNSTVTQRIKFLQNIQKIQQKNLFRCTEEAINHWIDNEVRAAMLPQKKRTFRTLSSYLRTTINAVRELHDTSVTHAQFRLQYRRLDQLALRHDPPVKRAETIPYDLFLQARSSLNRDDRARATLWYFTAARAADLPTMTTSNVRQTGES